MLLHGYGEHLGLYDALAHRLTAAGHAVHALDCVGHGHSDGERGRIDTWDDYVSDARTLVRIATDQHPGAPVVLVGHSGGALAAYLVAARHPQLAAAAVLSGAPLAPLDWVAAELAGESPETDDPDPTELFSTHPGVRARPDARPAVRPGRLPPRRRSGRCRPRGRRSPRRWPTSDLDLPVLLLHGEDDPIVPVSVARSVAAALPRATLRVFPGDLHDVLNEHDRDIVHERARRLRRIERHRPADRDRAA